MGTKLKIILFIFAVVVGLYVIQFMVTSVSSATSSSKRESFEVDEKPNEEPANKKDEKPKVDDPVSKSRLEKEVKLNILENVENVFEKFYPESDKKPVVFEMLTRKETFEEIKDKYEKDTDGVALHIRNFIKKTMKDIEEQDASKPKTKEQYEQELMDKPIDTILEKLDTDISTSKILSDLDELSTKISDLQEAVKKMQAATPSAKKPGVEKFTQGKKSNTGIEGFENRLNYASY
jgi:uncharacterized protein (DUF433 family)